MAAKVLRGLFMAEELLTVIALRSVLHSQQVTIRPSMSHAASTMSSEEVSVAEELPRQWVVMRRDLAETWPTGSIVAQACHASVAAIWQNKDDELTQLYMKELAHMHKVVLEVRDDSELNKVAKKLEDEGIIFSLWIEQPENIPTCLATKPYFKKDAPSALKRLRLCS